MRDCERKEFQVQFEMKRASEIRRGRGGRRSSGRSGAQTRKKQRQKP
jgi:hypothetical protein